MKPSWVGAENEYAVIVSGPEPEPEHHTQIIRRACQRLYAQDSHSPLLFVNFPTPQFPMPLYQGDNYMLQCWLENGGRFYKDQHHIEYSTPECETVRELVLTEKAGEKIFQLLPIRESPDKLFVLKRICHPDSIKALYEGAEYAAGSHENYTISTQLFAQLCSASDIATAEATRLNTKQIILAAHLASRIIYTGSGYLQREKDVPEAGGKSRIRFWLSPRALFIWKRVSLGTTSNRPIINAKSESLNRIAGLTRLHLICGDANRSPWSLFLKYGTTRLLLAFLELADQDDRFALCRSIELFDPVGFMKKLSAIYFPSYHGRGIGHFRQALSIQRIILRTLKMERLLLAETVPETEEILELWESALEDLSREQPSDTICRRLDWLIKKRFYEEAAGMDIADLENGLDDPAVMNRLLKYDFSYHRVNRSDLYERLETEGRAERFCEPQEVMFYLHHPPRGRAALRTEACHRLIEKNCHGCITSIHWQEIYLRIGTPEYCGQPFLLSFDETSPEELKLRIDLLAKQREVENAWPSSS